MRNKSIIDNIATGRASVLLTLTIVISMIVVRGLFFAQTIVLKPDYGLFSEIIRPYAEHPLTRTIVEGIFILVFAFVLNHADTRYNIIRIRTSLPFFITSLLLTTNSFLLGNLVQSIGAILMLLAISSLFESYQEPRAEKNAFDIALLLSLASLFWIKTIYFLPIFWFGLYTMKTLSFKSWMASIVGILAPYWFAFFYFAYQNNYDPLINYGLSIIDFSFIDFSQTKLFTWIHLGITIVTTFFALSHAMFSSLSDKIRTRSYLIFLIVLLFSSFVLTFVDFEHSGSALYLSYLISAFLIAHLFASVKGRFTSFLFHIMLYSYLLVYLWSLS